MSGDTALTTPPASSPFGHLRLFSKPQMQQLVDCIGFGNYTFNCGIVTKLSHTLYSSRTTKTTPNQLVKEHHCSPSQDDALGTLHTLLRFFLMGQWDQVDQRAYQKVLDLKELIVRVDEKDRLPNGTRQGH